MARRDDAPRDLLFGLLALQTGLVNQAALVAAFHAWTQDRRRPMAEILVELGALDNPRMALIEGLVGEHLKLHGGDVERSLAALGSPGTRPARAWRGSVTPTSTAASPSSDRRRATTATPCGP